MSGETRRLATFEVGPHRFGVAVDAVQEVIAGREVAPVPLAPPEIAGLVNLRGQIVTVVDLRRRLQVAEGEPPERPALVVLRRERSPVALAVDAAGDVVEVAEDTFEPPPETLRGEIRELIPGAYALEDRLVLALELERTLDIGVRRAGAAAPGEGGAG